MSPKPSKITAYLLIATLALFSVGGAVAHYCFDGLEPPVSLHFESIGGHIEHGAQSEHNDFEQGFLADNLLAKVIDLDLLYLIFAVLVFLVFSSSKSPIQLYLVTPKRKKFFTLHPPLRAPPYLAYP
ncbi:MAG: hypothetical protein COA78_34430 [Blastopirellula sp.]|nr:MAG: hypothetical protein COA78_34430 [Blastopirellula sp.]